MNQQRVWREYASRGTDEVGTTAAGILFRRAKLLERTGILEEEEEAERQAEAEVRAEATRRLVESRTQIERAQMREGEDNGEATDDSNEMTEQMLSKEILESRFHADERECVGAHWIDPDDLAGTSKFYVPEAELSDQSGEPEESDAIVENALHYAGSESKMESESMAGATTNINEDDSTNVQSQMGNENNQSSEAEMMSDDMDPLLRRVHTSPMIVTRKVTNDSKQSAKRRIKSTVTLPDIVVNTATDFKIPERYESTAGDEDYTEEENLVANAGDVSNEKQERLLPHRKQTVHGNIIQSAYFQSKITKIQVPSTSLTPPQVRRVASPTLGRHHLLNTNSPGQSPKTRKKIAPNLRRISSPGSSIGGVLDEETTASSTEDKKLTTMLRRISSPNPSNNALNQGTIDRSGSPSPANSPETSIRGGVSLQTSSPGQDSRKLKEKFMLEAKLYIPKASKNERRHIVPDKQEMLFILEEQKRELQKRIDRFLARQVRRSKTGPENITSNDI